MINEKIIIDIVCGGDGCAGKGIDHLCYTRGAAVASVERETSGVFRGLDNGPE